jgi:hypothetical protein
MPGNISEGLNGFAGWPNHQTPHDQFLVPVAKKEAIIRCRMNGRCGLASKLGLLLWIMSFTVSVPAIAWVETTSRIAGIVKDPSGAVVPGASVTVKNENTAELRRPY